MTTMTMDPGIKTGWTAWLRDPQHEQGAEYLRMGSRFCCLGGLCVLAGEAEIIEPRPADGYYDGTDDYDGVFFPDPDGRWDYGQPEDEEVLPSAVQDWAGLHGEYASNPLVQVPDEIVPRLTDTARDLLRITEQTHGTPGTITLAQLNDAGVPFSVIADIIDACL
jgi:hypothetical protein